MPEPDQTSPDKVADNLPPCALALSREQKGLHSRESLLAKCLAAAPSSLDRSASEHSDHPLGVFFTPFDLLVDAASIFIVSSATMDSLLESPKVAIDNHKKELLRQEQLIKERESFQAGFKDRRVDGSQVGLGWVGFLDLVF